MQNPLKNKALNHLLDGLRNLGCNYVVLDPDGQKHEHGSLKKKQKKIERKYPYGAVRNYYLPFIESIKPGELIEIPSNGFDLLDLQSGVSAKAHALFGPSAVMTSIKRDTDSLEVLRVL